MVKRIVLLVSAVTLSVVPVLSQPIPAGMKVGLPTYLRAAYGGLKVDLTEAAAMMPAEHYGFRPVSTAEMRTFGQLVAHVADGQFGTCASLKGVSNPWEGKHLERDLKSKEEFVKALADSFSFCDQAFADLTDENVLGFVSVGQGEVVRSGVMTGILAHDSEMYGIATVYLRAKNLIPPSTRRQMRTQPPSPR